jgi:hypothetical protein
LFLSEGAIKTLVKHQRIQGFLIEKLKPEKKDVIIIGSSKKNKCEMSLLQECGTNYYNES